MAKPKHKKTEAAEQVVGDPGPRPLVVVEQRVLVCAACGDQVGDDAKVVALNAKPALPAKPYVVHPAVACLTLLLLIGLAAMVWAGVFTPEQFFHMMIAVLACVFVVPFGIDQVGRLVKRFFA